MSPKANHSIDKSVREAHFGWIYHSPDTGIEWAPQHPVESGEVPDAEDVRAATLEVLHERMTAAWREVHAERRMREVAERRTAPLSPDEGMRAALVAIAREACARRAEENSAPLYATRYRAGELDGEVAILVAVDVALAALSTPVPEEGLPRGASSAAAAAWQPIETAPKDGTEILGGFFDVPWADSHMRGCVVKCWYQPEFGAFISSARVMTLARGLTFEDGSSESYHSPEIEAVSHWMPLPAPPLPPSSSPEDQQKADATPTIADPDGEARS